MEVAPPPPPPPPEEPPPPPEPEEEEPPPELNTPPPPISLEQLDLALNPGTGGAIAGDFALPTFDVSGSDLGGLEIFELGDVDSPPTPRTRIEFSYPAAAKRKGIKGIVKVEYIVSEKGRVEDIKIVESPDRILSGATIDVIRPRTLRAGNQRRPGRESSHAGQRSIPLIQFIQSPDTRS